jgi:very-short-patch-repair endonuclease
MPDDAAALLARQGGVATTAQLLNVLSRSRLDTRIRTGDLIKVWPGVYSREEPDNLTRLRGLDLRAGEPVAICLGTAAAAYGFDTEDVIDLHVLNPDGHQLRASDGLIVHRRDGAPLAAVGGRPATTAAWTAVEVARALRRPRALATLDAALRSGTCDRRQLLDAVSEQHGRRGIVHVRELVPHADPAAESPMESEARLVMLDGHLAIPELQYKIVDRSGRMWRLDFAWPLRKLAVEYDGFDWHSDPASFARDRQKRAALMEMDWTVLSIVADDVRRRPDDLLRRVEFELERRRAA